jgi:TPP-dependent pyruvate/acetoin dehydrogenase alpha subunit
MSDKKFRLDVFRTAAKCRNFENYVYKMLEQKVIKFPTYMSAGQEYIPATVATVLKNQDPLLFAQHRCHSWYIAFGGSLEKLVDELLGRETGCAYGMGGSASVHGPEINMYGHDGFMGSQVPIAVGAAYSSGQPTIAVMGDASAEEDYVMGALGWASTKKLPILFIVEDNNLSILTEKKVRRNWEMSDVAQAFQMKGLQTSDDPLVLRQYLETAFKEPMLLNVNTNRLYWHSGAGKDSDDTFDRYKHEMGLLGDEALEIDNECRKEVEKIWEKQLEKP